MEALEELQHRAVVLLEQTGRDADVVVGVDPDEILIEGAVMDRAQADAVAHDGVAVFLEIANDVSGVEQPKLLEPADRALVAVGRQNLTAKAPLMDPDVRLADDVSPLDRVGDPRRLSVVERAAHRAGLDENTEGCGIVGDDGSRAPPNLAGRARERSLADG